MKKSLFVIEDFGGEYEEAWTNIRPWGFATYEKAEKKLLSKKWTSDGDGWFSNPNNSYAKGIIYEETKGARILEINYWEV